MNELKVVENNSTSVMVAEDYKAIAAEWLTSMGMKLSENHKKQFIDICSAFGLNPIKKEVYGVPYGDKFSIIVGYESYIKRAERSERLNGWKVEIVGSGDNMKAVITINRKDWDSPFVHEVYFEEYNTNQNLWKSKPRTMLKKVAIAQGFRMCFSEELGGMPYTADELPEEMSNPTPIEKDITPSTSSEKTPKTSTKSAQKFTKLQSETLKQLVQEEYSDGSPIFAKSEKDTFRNMLVSGQYEDALNQATALKEQRLSQYQKDKAVADKIADAFDGAVVDETPIF